MCKTATYDSLYVMVELSINMQWQEGNTKEFHFLSLQVLPFSLFVMIFPNKEICNVTIAFIFNLENAMKEM